MRKLKIAIVTTMAESPWGGSEELWAATAALALQEGHEVMALVPAWKPRHARVQELADCGMKVADWGEYSASRESNAQAGRPAWHPYHPLLEFEPDLVFVSHGGLLDCVNGHVLLVQMLLENNLRFILMIQANTDLYFPNDNQREILQIYYARAEKVFFAARQNLEIARRQLAIPLENGAVFYSPVKLSRYDQVAWPESGTALMASVARLDAFPKGQDLLLEVLGQEKWRHRDWKLTLFGTGIHENYFRELVRYYRLEEKVEIPGKNVDMRQIWSGHQILLLPSRLEGTPIVLFGSMLCGRTAVVTDVGGNADFIRDGENGFVAAAASVSLVDQAMERAWGKRDHWLEMGQRARDYFLQHHEIHTERAFLAQIKNAVPWFGGPATPEVQAGAGAPRISVIIPCYNYARYLADAVSSVIAQSCQDFEIIIVNDGSTDNTRDVAERLLAQYPRHSVRLINQENSGQPAISRNNAIRVSRGRYVICLDADDMLAPTMLEQCLRLLESHPEISIAYTDRLDFDGVEGVVQAGEYDFSRLIEANHISYCALYPREVWERVGGYRENVKAVEDWDFWIAAGALGFRGKRIPLPLFKYRRHDTGIFQDALKNFHLKQAQVILNNAALYDPALVARAKEVLGATPGAPSAPLVSVIVPTHNRPGLLKKAVQSILDQTFQNLEIIVVNDAGQDVSQVVEAFGSPNLSLHCHETNQGLAAARNTGIRAAKGKYIAYLDDDDLFYPEHLATLVERLESDGSFVAYTDAHRVHLEKRDGVTKAIGRDLPYSEDFDCQRILFDNFIPVLCVMHRRECLERVGGFDPLLHRLEDWDLWIRMSRHYEFHHIREVTCAFSWFPEGGTTMTGANREPFEWAMLRVSHKRRHLLPPVPAAAAWQAEFVTTAAERLSAALGKALDARRYAPRAIFGTDDMNEVLSDAALLSEQHPEHRDRMARLSEAIRSFATLGAECGSGAPQAGGPPPLVSVIVPTFNRPETLRVALESILAQSFTDFEIVVVNDAGSEVSAVLNDLSHRDRIVYLRHQVNRGLAAARNTGIEAARGRYIAYLDDDDTYYPDHLETLVSLLQTRQCQVAYTDAFCALQRPGDGGYQTVEKNILYSCEFDYDRIMVENFIPVLCIMHEKSCLAKSGRFDESLKRHEDWDLWIRMSRHFRFTHLARATCEYTFRTDGSGMTSGTLPTFLISMRRVYQKYAQVVAGNSSLVQGQKHAITQLNLSVFKFLEERMAPFETLSAIPFNDLQQTGATRTQIMSTYHYLKGKTAGDASEKVLLLENALAECRANHQACMDLVTIYIESGAYGLADARLSLLEEADPGDQTIAGVRKLLQDRLAATSVRPATVPDSSPLPEKGESVPEFLLGTLQGNRDDPEALLGLGRICASQGRADDARLIYDRILAIVPGQPQALDELAQLAGRRAPAVSIVIPVFNKLELTRGCLESLASTTDPELFELILVDNGSSDGTWSYLAALPTGVKLVKNQENLGFAKACNQGAALARGRYLLFLNNDIEALPGWLEPLLAVLDMDPTVVAAGSKLLFPDGTIQHAGVIMAKVHSTGDHLVPTHIYYKRPADQPEAGVATCYQALTGACLAVRREQFSRVGGFDEGYWNGYEDVDLCLKLGGAGAKLVYQPESVLIHYEAQSGTERSARGHDNVSRLHQKWLGKVPIDYEIAADGALTQTPGAHPLYRAQSREIAVSVVIPVFNQVSYTKGCLEALFAVTGEEISYEVIVVDNASSDGSPEYLRSLEPRIRVISNERNLGFAKASNQGARAARGSYLVFLNNDTLPGPGWLQALVRGVDCDGADLVGAKLLYPDGTVQHAGVGFAPPGNGVHVFQGVPGDHPAVNRKRFMQCVTGACLLLRRQLFLELDGFDEGFINGYEDVDFCLRAQAAGKKILYTPESALVHFEETSTGRKDHELHNRERFFYRWHGRIHFDNLELNEAEGLLRPIGDEHADRLYALLGSNDNAIFVYLNVHERDPDDTGALLNLGRACAAKGRPDDARVFLERLLKLKPAHPAALQALAGLAGGDRAATA